MVKDLMNEIMSRNDYINLIAQLVHASDTKTLLYFMLYKFHDHSLSNRDFLATDLNWRVVRFLLKVVSKALLSREDLIDLASRFNHPSATSNLLEFILCNYCKFQVSNPDCATVDITRRASQLMLELFSKMQIISPPNIAYDLDAYAFPFLLYLLNNRKVRDNSSGMQLTQELIARHILGKRIDGRPYVRYFIEGRLHQLFCASRGPRCHESGGFHT
jgi:hypothetical protein